ncbi:YcxB family protein [Brucella pituitosa]|nr:YcxB family protein [Brucella pituitosa]
MLEYSFALRPEGLEAISDRGQTLLRWEDFIGWRMNNKMTLIYLAPNLFQIFPNRLAEQGFHIEDLKAALASKVGQPTRWYK